MNSYIIRGKTIPLHITMAFTDRMAAISITNAMIASRIPGGFSSSHMIVSIMPAIRSTPKNGIK
jgi:hypothetical protein